MTGVSLGLRGTYGLETLGGSFSQAIWLNNAGEAVGQAALQAMNPSMRLYGEVVRAHRSSLVFTVHNVGEIAAPLAHGIDALHVCDA